MTSYRILPLIGCALLALPVWAQSPATSPSPAPEAAKPAPAGNPATLLRQLDEGFSQIFEKTAPSVVVIDVTKKHSLTADEGDAPPEGLDFFFRAPDAGLRNPSPLREPSTQSEGSGFVIRTDGVILTNNHVIRGADKITVKLKDGRQFPAKVLGADAQSDIAVIKIEASGLPVVEWGNSDKVRIGQLVCTIGVPYAMEYSFTFGCISGKGRSGLTPEVTPVEDYLQTSALINPGNSGGPLIDVEGRVVGMTTLVNGLNRGLAFAIPSKMLQKASAQLIDSGKVAHPALGIRIETLGADSTLREQIQGVDKGVVITTIEPDTPAYKSDLRPADVITAIDGVPVATALELRRQVLAKAINQTVALTVWRAGKTLQINVTTAEMPTSRPPQPATSRLDPSNPEAACGLRLAEVTQAAADRLGLKTRAGALVSSVEPASPAAVAGIQRDDVITEIDSKPVTDVSVARKLLENHDRKKAVLLFVERKGQKTYAVVKIEK